MASWDLEAEAAKQVAVVGTWSPVGEWLCRRLLQKGYRVVSALPTRPEQAAELMGIAGAEDSLELREADLLDYASLTSAISGCSAVFLTSPAAHSLNGLPEYPGEAINFEIGSTMNVVEACSNTPSIKRLLLTSCASTMVFDIQQSAKGTETVDERCWSNLDFCRENKLWGAVCKTLVEKAAWALARDRGVDLVVINPATVVGPNATTSGQSLISSLRGKEQNPVMAYAHVDDVAEAHIQAFEKRSASGRFLCYNRLFSVKETRELQARQQGNHCLPSRFLTPWGSGSLSNQKLQRLVST
ncbi:hypothetical protein R1flu_027191 [Riccia fluitans]|uniref:NAD-dependent epimerase/dehydratase domain-containing protein n=1 Tax=Riccia fluitans TaxID=41844 RepID=A0ABD1XI31_9MARC